MTTKQQAKVNATMNEIINRVIEQMEAGTAPWQKPWNGRSNAPTNLATGKEYTGLNWIYLSILSVGYDYNLWIGYGQARKLGGHVRKGEKGTPILRPMMRKGEDAVTGDKFMYCAGFTTATVFNVAQCDGLELPEIEMNNEIDATALDGFVQNTGADVRFMETDRAFYRPSEDFIVLPLREQFKTEGGFYGTLLHELTHWTGHKSRLDRLSEKNTRGYAFEELIAELGAYFTATRLHCPHEHENHASYLQNWLTALRDDREYLWKAASAAERASNHLLSLQNDMAQAA